MEKTDYKRIPEVGRERNYVEHPRKSWCLNRNQSEGLTSLLVIIQNLMMYYFQFTPFCKHMKYFI